ncbi:PilZ domain-containing protein [Rhizobiaceae bacterium BDR2-2]|uniref:PilZ domain-containing protein n=1 Tax=Ectorhizobium quercum TaxID=2965071 RepID=A0AAE3SVJ3_9HYPH|nr:PilZ domain-containing protein [Ectorhizobium quercum]MCX8997733.1 PilZ domain-containing protein [Ectorhizobium quercum]
MLVHQPVRAVFAKRPEVQEVFHRVSVNLPGRMMLADRTEYDCLAIDMSPGDVVIGSDALPRMGERVIAYIDHLGRLEGQTKAVLDRAFIMTINATERKREKLAAQLTWIANRHELGLPEDRRHTRLTPRTSLTRLTLEDGRTIACRLIDLSLSGAAIDLDGRLPIGTPVRLGSIRARVVRHFAEGIALEFSSVQSRETLAEFL